MEAVEATVHDPDGPRLRRWLPYLIGVPFLLVGGVLWSLTHLFGFLAIAGLALVIGGPPMLGRQKATRARVRLFPGGIEIPRRKILTRQVTGATAAARDGGGYTLALALGKKASPVQIEVETLEELKAIRDALGIGHSGFGEVTFWTAPRAVDSLYDAIAILVGLGFVTTAILRYVTSAGDLANVLLALSILGSLFIPILVLFKLTGVRPFLTVTEGGVTVRNLRGTRHVIPYPWIQNIFGTDRSLVLGGPKPNQVLAIPTPPVTSARRGLTREEGALLRAQIASALARTRGEGPVRVDPSERVAMLERRGEPARAWLARVETAASTVATSGYRGGTLTEDDLWAVAEDHDADSDARAAALRVLTRVAPDRTRVRVDAIVASVHDETVRKRIRVALEPDVETAAAELEAMERTGAAR